MLIEGRPMITISKIEENVSKIDNIEEKLKNVKSEVATLTKE